MMRSSVQRWFTFRRVASIVALTFAWCALWGSLSAANLLSGVAISTVATTLGNPPRSGGVRIVPLVQLVWLVLVDLAVSTAVVVREVLTPTDYTDEAIIAVPIPPGGRSHLLFMYVAITLTPGTAVVASEADASVIYLHVLHADRHEEVESHTRRLFDLVDRALPSDVASVRDDGAAR